MRRSQRGFTLVELIIVVAIVGLLASAALPLARWSVKRGHEHELQQDLRILRNAIDRYHDAALAGLIEVPEGTNGYPASLDELVEGVPLIAPMPSPVPGVADEYDATGPGLTGGLPAQVQAQAQQGGVGTGAPATGGVQGPGFGARGAPAQPGGRNLFSSGGTRGQPGESGGGFGAAGTGGFGAGAGRGRTQSSTLGSSTGRGQGGFGQSGFGQQGSSPGAFGGQAGTAGEPAQPILGADGQPVKLILLRRLPRDPFTGKSDWGLRCYGEPPEDRLWCGRDVFDVYSKSFAKAIDGSNYRDW